MIMRNGIVLLACLLLVSAAQAESVEKWGRFSVSYGNSSWEGNPFEVELRGVFTSPTGRVLKQWGFYGGARQWSLYFMPDEEGRWSFKTVSTDPDLEGKTGFFHCGPSDLPGQLVADGNRWRLSDAGGAAPIIWNPPLADGAHYGFRERSITDPAVHDAISLAHEVVGARVVGFHELLIIPTSWAREWPQGSVPYVVGREGEEFHLPFWDCLNAKLDALRERGMGHYIMFYSDDALTPDRYGITPRSPAELRFFRYALARLACYPIVLWDTGIDIGEYRDDQWIDWFAEWFNQNDPWRHPTGSRTGGGSGGAMPATATYYSVGGADLPTRDELLSSLERNVPTAHTDHWRPFIGRGHWTHDKIRTAIWHCALAGGQASYPDYNQGVVKEDGVRAGAAAIGFATRFFRRQLRGDIAGLRPHDELISAGENAILAANQGHEYVLYDLDGGSATLDLSHAAVPLAALWYNPRTGATVPASVASSSGHVAFSSPTSGPGKDWVLHVHARP
jgi:uncharacterized protein DUF5060/collagenase-like protein with putative collagen-binding domain